MKECQNAGFDNIDVKQRKAMSYDHLSREELIEELERLKKENEDIQKISRQGNNGVFPFNVQDLFDAITDRVLIIDSRMNVLYVNKAMKKWYPEAPKYLGMKCYELVWCPEKYCNFCPCQKAVTQRSAERIEIPFPVEGQNQWVEMSAFPLCDHSGRVSCVIKFLRDITEVKETQKELENNRDFLNAVINAMPTPLFSKDRDGRYSYVNESFADYIGIPSDRIIGKTVEECWPMENAKVYHQKDLEIMDKDGIQTYEYKLHHVDKGLREGIFTKTCLHDHNGFVSGLVGTFLDIHERKEMEKALKENENKYRTIFETTGTATMIFDDSNTILLVNREFELLSGYSKEELEGNKKWTDFVASEDDLNRMLEYDRMRKENPKSVPKHYEFRFQDRGGQFKDINVTVDMIPESSNRVASFLDVTDYKKAKQTLRESEKRYRTIFEYAHDALLLASSNLRFVEFNQRALEMLGVEKKDLLGKTALDFSPVRQPDGSYSAEKKKKIAERALAGQPQYYEWKYKRSDGTLRDAEVASVTISMAGRTYLLSSLHDITDRRQAEIEREFLIKELEAKNEELESFTYTISHDLKNPLVTIKGFLGLLEKDALAGDIKRLQEDKGYIEHAAGKMEQLLDEILELSRIGRISAGIENVDLNEVVYESLKLTQGKIDERGVAVSFSPELPTIKGERMRLVQLFQNIIANAIIYMGEQEQPQLEIGVRDIRGSKIIYVQDNGIGIEPRYHEKIFGLFEQLVTDKGGTGIGLALVKRIVETHGGTIWVESDGSGHGSTFCFTLPGKVEKEL